MQGTELVKLIDTTKCTACRGCQVACKQWNEMPGLRTRNRGSYQNPPDLQWNTWTLVRFQEHEDSKGVVKWLFRKDGCMHCTDAACVKVCPSGALYHTEFGTVGLNKERCIGCKECMAACPFDVPQYDQKSDKIYKCDLCISRLREGLTPACVKSCPTGGLTFGGKDGMIKIANKRVEDLKSQGHEDANVYGDKFVKGTHVMYVLDEKPAVYERLPRNPSVPLSVILWKDFLKPLSLIAAGGVLAGSFLHYIIHGPKLPDEETSEKNKGGE
jgi:formate dehydrogenase beta subunit